MSDYSERDFMLYLLYIVYDSVLTLTFDYFSIYFFRTIINAEWSVIIDLFYFRNKGLTLTCMGWFILFVI